MGILFYPNSSWKDDGAAFATITFFLTPQPNSKKQSELLLSTTPLLLLDQESGRNEVNISLVSQEKKQHRKKTVCHLCQEPLKEIGEEGGRRGSVWTTLDAIYSVFGDKYEEKDMYSSRAEDQRNRLASSRLLPLPFTSTVFLPKPHFIGYCSISSPSF